MKRYHLIHGYNDDETKTRRLKRLTEISHLRDNVIEFTPACIMWGGDLQIKEGYIIDKHGLGYDDIIMLIYNNTLEKGGTLVVENNRFLSEIFI